MSVLWAVLSTFSIGLGEFFAGDLTTRARSQEVTSTMFLAGFVSMIAVAAVWRGEPTGLDFAYGGLAGAANGAGILLVYLSYSKSSLRVAAPTAAVVMSAVPVFWDVVISGNSPSQLTSIGLVLGLVSIGLSSYSPGSDPVAASGVRLAILGGIVFGVLLILISYISDGAGGSPILLQRTVAFVVAVMVTKTSGPRLFPAVRRDFWLSILVGLFATAAMVMFFLALQSDGSLAVVSVVGSQFAAVAVVLGLIFRNERLWWWQGIGLVGASVAVALISVG